MSAPQENALPWYVMTGHRLGQRAHHTPQEIVQAYNARHSTSLQIFAPTFLDTVTRAGQTERISRPLLHQYLFLKAPKERQLEAFRADNPTFNFVYDSRDPETRRRLTLSPRAMHSFQIIARAYQNQIPCFRVEEAMLEKGDKVRIIGGIFDGVEGILVSTRGTQKGRVVMQVTNTLGVATYDIEPRFLQVLEFAKGSKSPYDILDAWQRLLNKYQDDAPTPTKGSASMEVTLPSVTRCASYGEATSKSLPPPAHHGGASYGEATSKSLPPPAHHGGDASQRRENQLSLHDRARLQTFQTRYAHTQLPTPRLRARLQDLLRLTHHLLQDYL